MTKCGCCGGYLISINNQDFKFFQDDVDGSGALEPMMHYPVYVYVKWSMKTGSCSSSDRIVVDEILFTTKLR